MPRKSEGKKKIEIVKIMDESSASVTFTKRRGGAFKKASELCTLCGAQIAVIVQSRTKKKVYSFGKPDVDEVVNRFLNLNLNHASSSTSHYVELIRDAKIKELYAQLAKLESEVGSEKKVGEEVKNMGTKSQEHYWWNDMENARFVELEQLKMAMSQLQEVAQKHLERHEA